MVKRMLVIMCLCLIVSPPHIFARVFSQNPVHPNWQKDIHRLKHDAVMLRYGHVTYVKKALTVFVALEGDVIAPWHTNFVGRHTVMAYLGKDDNGKHLLLFGWQFHPDYTPPSRYHDEFVILQFTPRETEEDPFSMHAGFNDAVTYLEAVLYSPEKLNDPTLQEMARELHFNLLTCPGDYAILHFGETMRLDPIEKAIVEEALENPNPY